MTNGTPVEQVVPEPEGHFWDYLLVVIRRRRVALSVFALVVALGGLRILLTRPVYSATAELLIERQKPNVVAFKEVAEVDAARDDYYQTQQKLLQSRALARGVIESLNLLQDPDFGGPRSPKEIAGAGRAGESSLMEKTIDAFQKRLTVQLARNSRILRVSFEAYRPHLAADVTNKLVQLYIQQSLDFRFQTSTEATHWLEGQIQDQRTKVTTAEASLRQLKERLGLVNYEERRTLLDQSLKELGSALNERKTDRLRKEALFRQMASAATPEDLPEVMRSPIVQSLGIELANLERQRAVTLEKYGERHPENVKIHSQIAETKAKMSAEAQRIIHSAENDYRAAASQEASLRAELETRKLEGEQLAKTGLEYESGKRELDANQQVLNGLLSRSKETNVASELKSTNIRIVDAAVVPEKPARPRPLRDLLITLALATLFSMIGAFLVEYLDDRINTPEDVHRHLGVPLLGVVPELTAPADPATPGFAFDSNAPTPLHEGYRLVRTALDYSWPEEGPRMILVTSTAPGEGKTLSTVNLGMMLAAQDKVLLLDCDLRKPQIHRVTNCNKVPGLSDILVGRAKPSEVIQQLDKNLTVITAGTAVPNPADLMTSKSLRGLLARLRGPFRWVVIDTPPVGAVSEALMLAPIVDGVIVVAGAEMVPRKAIEHTLGRLTAAGAHILGLLLNRAQIERHSYYYSRYYGHYSGGYGQVEAAAPEKVAGAEGSIS